ncbi:MAG: hypothetical protein KAH11_08365 [Rhodospirillales bacterium]|nr:hypothetical protein [Rhodospirillales bacterium]
MLQQKLDEANRTAKWRRIQALGALAGAAIFVGLFVSGVIKLDFSILGEDPVSGEIASTAPSSTEPAATTIAAPEPSQVPSPEAPPTNIGAPSVAPTQQPPQPAEMASSQEPAVNTEELRQRFKTDLGTFEDSISPIVEAPGFKQWDPAGFNEIQSKKDAAISAFSTANYAPALAKIEAATTQATSLIAQRDTEFEAAIKAAAEHLETDDFEQGSIEIAKALRIMPSSQDAIDLKTKIDSLPEVLAAVEKAAIARTENNLELELEHLAAAMELDPDRPGVSERHAEVAGQLKEERFATLIERGLNSIERRDLEGAQASLKTARTIFPSKSELKLFATRIESLRKELAAERFIAEAVEASKKDDWVTAEKLFKDAGKVLPDNKDATDGALLASTINGYDLELTRHLQAPDRLSSSNVSEIVTDLIANAEVYSAFSPSLAKQTAALKTLQAAYSSPVHITVLSDGETKVTVRGVGIVGNNKVKVIQLKPGKYKFEGARPGFQSKIIDLEVAPGAESLSVTVVCDERI